MPLYQLKLNDRDEVYALYGASPEAAAATSAAKGGPSVRIDRDGVGDGMLIEVAENGRVLPDAMRWPVVIIAVE